VLEVRLRCPLAECRARWLVRQEPGQARAGYLCVGCGRSFTLQISRIRPSGSGAPPYLVKATLEHEALPPQWLRPWGIRILR